jgi:hypothetical protein
VSGNAIHTLKFSAADGAGNQETEQTAQIKIDGEKPVITWHGWSPAANAKGWNNTAVTATFSAGDAVSGIGTLTPASPSKIEGEGKDQTQTLVATDVAGNQTTFVTPAVNIDKTAPATTDAISGRRSSNGIYTGVATVTLSATDALSGVESTSYSIDGGTARTYNGPFEVGGDGAHTVEYWSVDNAGNVEGGFAIDIVIDSKAPKTTATLAGTAGQNGWFTSAVTATLEAADANGTTTSYKLDGGEARPYNGPLTIANDGRHTLEFWSEDSAGNREEGQTIAVNIDTQAPALTWGAPTPAPNANGWHSANVGLPFTASDVTSGVASTSVPGPLQFSSEGRDQSQEVTVTDKAGLQKTVSSPRVNIDKTAPGTTATVAAIAGLNGWLRSNATITLAAADALSGVQNTQVSVDGNAAQPYTAPFAVTGNGTHTISFWSVDKAGNTEAAKTQSFKIDAQVPTLTITATPGSARSSKNPLSVRVTGKLSDVHAGFDATGGTYSVADEYGRSQPSGPLTFTADGSYAFTLSLEGNKNANDKDSRRYTITTNGRDRAGNTVSATAIVTITK